MWTQNLKTSSVFYFSVGQPPRCIAGNPFASAWPQKFTTSACMYRSIDKWKYLFFALLHGFCSSTYMEVNLRQIEIKTWEKGLNIESFYREYKTQTFSWLSLMRTWSRKGWKHCSSLIAAEINVILFFSHFGSFLKFLKFCSEIPELFFSVVSQVLCSQISWILFLGFIVCVNLRFLPATITGASFYISLQEVPPLTPDQSTMFSYE